MNFTTNRNILITWIAPNSRDQKCSCILALDHNFKQSKYASERTRAASLISCNVVYRPIDNRNVLAASSKVRPLLMRTLEAASFPV